MTRLIDLTGLRFGRLTVVERSENRNGLPSWLCRCDCGSEVVVLGCNLRSGKTASCGCSHVKHGLSKSRLYGIWEKMKARCLDERAPGYEHYGGRGIRICDEWLDAEAFLKWSLENGYDESLTIDRIDVNGNYEPCNCRWATMVEQNNNRRNNAVVEFNGERRTVSEWAKSIGMQKGTLLYRLKKYPPEIAFTMPMQGRGKKQAA